MTLYLIVPNLPANEIIFVSNRPIGDVTTYQVDYETRLYKYDLSNNKLSLMWTLGDKQEARKVGVYTDNNVIIVLGSYFNLSTLHLLNLEDIDNSIDIHVGDSLRIDNFHYYSNKVGEDLIEIRCKNINKSIKSDYESIMASVINGDILRKIDKNDFNGKIRLCGIGPLGIQSNDVISIHDIKEGKVFGKGTAFGFELNSIEKEKIKIGSSKGWIVIANEPNFYALNSIPDNNDLSQRELLIYNKINKTWKSIVLEGAEDGMRTINGWIVGRIEHKNPESDYESGKTLPSIIGKNAILLNPISGVVIYHDFGKASEVLWIENNTIYYKAGEQLYTAEISVDQIINEQIIYSNPEVRFFVYGKMLYLPSNNGEITK